MGQISRIARWAALMAFFAVLVPVPSVANDAGQSEMNFSESRGCEPHIAGPSRPFVETTGRMAISERIDGPWGAMFGRSYYQVSQSLVYWHLPGTTKSMRVHERILPALEEVAANLEIHLAQGKRYNVYSAYSWVWRTVGGTYRPSEHAFGSAFDINPSDNPYSADNHLRTNMPEWFVQSFVDAGFCWGGSWVDKKDAMHFSWSGPAQTPNYPGRPAPYPPLTGLTHFRGSVINTTSSVPARSGTVTTTGDFTRDGAPDIVQLSPSGRIEVAGAVGDYGTVAYRHYSGSGADGSLLGDYDLDGRPDVWVADRSGATLGFDVWTRASDFKESIRVSTSIPTTDSQLMLGMFDEDYLPDVYVHTDGWFTLYGSQGNYAVPSAQFSIPDGSSDSWHFATGDYDVDGRSDIYSVSNGSEAVVSIRLSNGSNVVMTSAVAVDSDSAVEFGDLDGDGRDDLYVLTGSALQIALGGASGANPSQWFESPGSTVYDAGPECVGERCDTIGYVDDGGVWTTADRPRTEAATIEYYYGIPGDLPFSGDWNCDGVDSPGLYRQSDGYVYLRNSNTQGVADIRFYFGNPGDIPLAGDFDGDGCDSVSLYRPSEQRVYIINELGQDEKGLGAADFFYVFGVAGDIPFVGDFDGDGVDGVAILRPSAGTMFLKNGLSSGAADVAVTFGMTGDVPFAGDWNGDGVDTVALYRPSGGDWFIKLSNTAGGPDHEIHLHGHHSWSLPFIGKMAS